MKKTFSLLLTLLCVSTFAYGCADAEAPNNDNDNSNDNQQPEQPMEPMPTAERYDLFPVKSGEDVAYRIPSLAVTRSGRLIAVADYRICRADIGVVKDGRIDLHYRTSDDHGHTWSDMKVLVEGKGAEASDFMSVGYGDPCIVADRESDRVLVLSCAGNVSFPSGTREVHQNVARFYSEDGGNTWSAPDDIAESIYSQFDQSSYGPVRSMFIASGAIYQSKHIKVGDYYRLYCAILARTPSATHMNFVLYSDDFGGTWSVLGDVNTPPVFKTADEAKVTELPDGSLLISSRYNGGRYYNIFIFTDEATATGSWMSSAFSGAENNGVTAVDNSTNGEPALIPAVRNADGEEVHLLLQSVPMGPERKNVGIYYKELASEMDYLSPAILAADWDGVMQVSTLNSAYSTMIWQRDNNLGFLYEEETYGVSAHTYGGYNIVYESFSVEEITDGKYSYRQE